MRPTDDGRLAQLVAAREDFTERPLLHHHRRGEDEIGPLEVGVEQRLHVHVDQPQLPGRGKERRDGQQPHRRHRRPLAEHLERIPKPPVRRRKLRIDEKHASHGGPPDSESVRGEPAPRESAGEPGYAREIGGARKRSDRDAFLTTARQKLDEASRNGGSSVGWRPAESLVGARSAGHAGESVERGGVPLR